MEALMSYRGYQLTKDTDLLRSLLDKVYEERGYTIASPSTSSEPQKQQQQPVVSNDKK